MSAFSETIKRIRQEKGMSQEEFARLLGTKKQNISRYESGEVSPMISTAAKMADKLGISLTELNGEYLKKNVWAAREALRRDPDRRALLDLAENGTVQDVRQVAALIDALKRTNPDFYDGDDPA